MTHLVEWRTTIRETWLKDSILCPNNDVHIITTEPCVVVRFVVGYDGYDDLIEENSLHGNDLVMLDMNENVNLGKSFSWFKYVANHIHLKTIPFVGKSEMDTLLWMSPPYLLNHLHDLIPPPLRTKTETEAHTEAKLMPLQLGNIVHSALGDVTKEIYYGAGHVYILSQPLGALFQNINPTLNRYKGQEDYVIGRFLHNLATFVQLDLADLIARYACQNDLEDCSQLLSSFYDTIETPETYVNIEWPSNKAWLHYMLAQAPEKSASPPLSSELLQCVHDGGDFAIGIACVYPQAKQPEWSTIDVLWTEISIQGLLSSRTQQRFYFDLMVMLCMTGTIFGMYTSSKQRERMQHRKGAV